MKTNTLIDLDEARQLEVVSKQNSSLDQDLSLTGIANLSALGCIVSLGAILVTNVLGGAPELIVTFIGTGFFALISGTIFHQKSRKSHQEGWVQNLIRDKGYTAQWDTSQKVRGLFVRGKQEIVPLIDARGEIGGYALLENDSASLLQPPTVGTTWDKLLSSVVDNYSLKASPKMSFPHDHQEVKSGETPSSLESQIERLREQYRAHDEKIKMAEQIVAEFQ